ncbi:MAG: NifU family protein [Bdellovibrionales bacterium]|nr:NifU family protein [Bdellovibrionales bacterium]
MSQAQDFSVELEFTPNPNTLKYVTNVAFLLAGAENFKNAQDAEGRSPLALKLFGLQGISGVMVGKNFVTITLADQEMLTELNEQIIDTIKKFLASGEKAVLPSAIRAEGPSTNTDIEQKIIDVLENEIRPAVAMDGGDITFERFENNVVFVHMKGSCAGCPSSTATLKMGIENRLREVIPDLLEVVAI